VNKGTLELIKKDWESSLHQIPQVVCFSGFMENFEDAESKFVAPNKVVFSVSYSKSRLVNKLKLFSRMSTTRAKILLRNQGTLLV